MPLAGCATHATIGLTIATLTFAPLASAHDGRWIGEGSNARCMPVCGFPHLTDPDEQGDVDGFGFEGQRTCIVAGTRAELEAAGCEVAARSVPPGGRGIYRETRCVPVCSSARTDPDPATGQTDGWGYERGRTCIVAGTAAALAGLPCAPVEAPLADGNGVEATNDAGRRDCQPFCRDPLHSDPDGDGFGYEHETTCVDSSSLAALQGVPCVTTDLPPPRPPPAPPRGSGWRSDYTATMFGRDDCEAFGYADPGDSDLERSTCASSGRLELNADNTKYFAAVGDLSSLWLGSPCDCSVSERDGHCPAPPACPRQANCGQCLEVACNFEGTGSFESNGLTHNEFCKRGRSVVVQLIDACPHNHPNNAYWCTEEQPEHVDLSCSAFASLTRGRAIGDIGSINVHVRRIDCAVGLGERTLR